MSEDASIYPIEDPLEPPEPVYTLAEARIILLREFCAKNGHETETTTLSNGEPLRIYCTRCDKSWKVTEE